jgi:hypothetical protein
MADRMAVSIAVRGRGRDERLPDVTVIDPCCILVATCRTTEVSPQRRASTMRRRLATSFWLIVAFGKGKRRSHPCGILKDDDPYAAHVCDNASLTHPASCLVQTVM